jgi:transposase
MIQITPQMRILLAVEPVDFRKGIDGLGRLCREVLKTDPFSGVLFVFSNKGRSALRVLVYDGQGFWLCHKRLSSGRFRWPGGAPSARLRSLAAIELQTLLANGDFTRLNLPVPWRSVSPPAPEP